MFGHRRAARNRRRASEGATGTGRSGHLADSIKCLWTRKGRARVRAEVRAKKEVRHTRCGGAGRRRRRCQRCGGREAVADAADVGQEATAACAAVEARVLPLTRRRGSLLPPLGRPRPPVRRPPSPLSASFPPERVALSAKPPCEGDEAPSSTRDGRRRGRTPRPRGLPRKHDPRCLTNFGLEPPREFRGAGRGPHLLPPHPVADPPSAPASARRDPGMSPPRAAPARRAPLGSSRRRRRARAAPRSHGVCRPLTSNKSNLTSNNIHGVRRPASSDAIIGGGI